MNEKYTREVLAEAATRSRSVSDVLRVLGLRLDGGTHSHISRRLKRLEIDTSHFVGRSHNRDKPANNRKSVSDILIRLPKGSQRGKAFQLRRALTEIGIPYQCVDCGVREEWNGKPLTLHVDHVDGNWLNCLQENLEFRCPNCHSQTSTFCRPKIMCPS